MYQLHNKKPIAIALALSLTVAQLGKTLAAELGDRATFAIQAQSLDTALLRFSEQAGIQVSVPASSTAGKHTAGISGEHSVEQALQALLKGSGLTYRQINPRTVAIGPGVDTAALDAPAGGIRLAQASDDAGDEPGSRGSMPARQTSDPAVDSQTGEKASIAEVVVTAQKRSERLQDVPISISVLGGDALDRSSAQGVTEALSTVPSVTAQESYIGGGTQISIRGVSASSPILHGSSPIAYYLDSVPFGLIKTSIAPDANAYDLERVEVLRGPQGTLYGASALNGVVRVLTRDADLDSFELKARSAVSTTEGGDANYRADAAINVPIVADRLALRVVAGYQDLGGWIERPSRSNVNSAQISNVRLKLSAQPTQALTIKFASWLSRDDRDGPPQARENDFHGIDAEEPQRTDYDAHGLTIGYEFPSFTLTSATSHLHYANRGVLNMGELGLAGFEFDNRYDAKVLAQEINLSSHAAGAWRWALGGMYRDEEDRTTQTFSGLLPVFDFTDTSESFAIYGEVTRVLLDGRLTLTAGARYFEDEVGTQERAPFDGMPGTPLIAARSSFDKLTTRAVITWLPSDDFTMYVSYGEGFRSGSQQQPSVIHRAPQIPPLDADSLVNYEVGSKGRLGAGLVTYEAAVYYLDWSDVQSDSSIFINGLPQAALVNGDSASGLGFDLSLIFQPIAGLDFGVAFSRNDLTYDSDVLSGGAVLFARGSRLSMSPRTSASGFINYGFPLGGRGYEGRFAASASYSSEQFIKIPDGIGQGDSILTARSSFSISTPSNWELTLYVDNLTNTDDAIQRAPFLNAPDWTVRPRPRTIGIQAEYRY